MLILFYMNDLDTAAFIELFKEAHQRCFSHPPDRALTETQSKQLSLQILEATGLVIGARTIRNYSAYVLQPETSTPENPSVATLDTLARYVLSAPYTDEAKRKLQNENFSWWFRYREEFAKGKLPPPPVKPGRTFPLWIILVLLMAGISIYVLKGFRSSAGNIHKTFATVNEDSLTSHGWILKNRDPRWWAKRGQLPGTLTLFTLQGDIWPDGIHQPGISNILYRPLFPGDFTMELHLQSFAPTSNWEQAGLLLSEDTSFTGKSLRFSIVYNDYAGPYPAQKEVLIQAIISGEQSQKPEEVVHIPILNMDSAAHFPALLHGLDHSALRIEKQGDQWRFLYSDGILEHSAFKEKGSHIFDFKPKFAAIFACKGFVSDTNVIPAHISSFDLQMH